MKVHSVGGDILAHLPREDGLAVMAAKSRVLERFQRYEVDLFEVWFVGSFALVVEVLDGGAAVGIVFDTEVSEEGDCRLSVL